LDDIDNRSISILDHRGLVGISVDNNGHVEPDIMLMESIVPRADFDEDSTEVAAAQESGLIYYGFQKELMWENAPDDGRPQPRLLSDREHITLGFISLEHGFEPVVTVLSSWHPVRAVDAHADDQRDIHS
jgi:hypothetical protein